MKVERAKIARVNPGDSRVTIDAGAKDEGQEVEAELGPVRYRAALIGVPDESVMRWFIAAIPFVVIRLRCSCSSRQRRGGIESGK